MTTEPRRRYSRIFFGQLRTSDDPADRDLYLESDNGTTLVCFSPGDMPALRAAVIPEDLTLASITEAATAGLGPAAARYVRQAHGAGYGLGVRDMEAACATVTEAERVSDWLDGFYESAVGGDEQSAVSLVREMIGRRLAGQEAGRG